MKSKRSMATTSFDPRSLKLNELSETHHHPHTHILEEIDGLIKVYKDGHIERPEIVPNIPPNASLDANLTAKDIIIDKPTNLWARIYAAVNSHSKLPLLLYFHGGGFCVGSASWSCFHNFLSKLASQAKCVIISVNYRLAPENRLPCAYEDAFKAFSWLKQQVLKEPSEQKWWLRCCNISSMFLAGDSAGANIAYNLATRIGYSSTELTILRPFSLKGVILIQPFFGGEARTGSEKYANQPVNSALTLSVSDTYWRLSLPLGFHRDHPWCNPMNGLVKLRDVKIPSFMVCVSEMDVLKDRNLEFCAGLVSAGKKVEMVMYKGVGHAFQVLNNSPLSGLKTQEMMSDIHGFLTK